MVRSGRSSEDDDRPFKRELYEAVLNAFRDKL
jgi:hypothetical protein